MLSNPRARSVKPEDIFYVSKKVLEEVRTKLKDGKDVVEADVDRLAFPEKLIT